MEFSIKGVLKRVFFGADVSNPVSNEVVTPSADTAVLDSAAEKINFLAEKYGKLETGDSQESQTSEAYEDLRRTLGDVDVEHVLKNNRGDEIRDHLDGIAAAICNVATAIPPDDAFSTLTGLSYNKTFRSYAAAETAQCQTMSGINNLLDKLPEDQRLNAFELLDTEDGDVDSQYGLLGDLFKNADFKEVVGFTLKSFNGVDYSKIQMDLRSSRSLNGVVMDKKYFDSMDIPIIENIFSECCKGGLFAEYNKEDSFDNQRPLVELDR